MGSITGNSTDTAMPMPTSMAFFLMTHVTVPPGTDVNRNKKLPPHGHSITIVGMVGTVSNYLDLVDTLMHGASSLIKLSRALRLEE
jgi:hypothetical protein